MPTQKVRCGRNFHHIDWAPTGPTLVDHRSPSESVLHALGGLSGCGSKIEAWRRYGIEFGEAYAWVAGGITDANRAARWRGFGFDPYEASVWERAGFRSLPDACVLWRAAVAPRIAELLRDHGLDVDRIAACGGRDLDDALEWHATGLATSVISLLRSAGQTPDTLDRTGKWVCPLCHRRFEPNRTAMHVGSQRCRQLQKRG